MSVFYTTEATFLCITVHNMSSQYNNSLTQSLEQGSDGITHRTLFVTP